MLIIHRNADDPNSEGAPGRVNAAKLDASRQFDILYDRYLGPRADVSDLEAGFMDWYAFNEKTVLMHQAGGPIEAGIRNKKTNRILDENMMARFSKVTDFASAKRSEEHTSELQSH